MTDTPPGAEFRLADMTPKRRRPLLIPLVAAGAVAVVAGGVLAFVLTRPDDPEASVAATPTAETTEDAPTPAASPSARAYTAAGSISIISGFTESGSSCRGKDRNSDLVEGARLSVLNAAGDPIAEGKLGPGLIDGLSCTFLFTVTNVPSGAGTYRVRVANRKSTDYSEADFAQGSVLNIML